MTKCRRSQSIQSNENVEIPRVVFCYQCSFISITVKSYGRKLQLFSFTEVIIYTNSLVRFWFIKYVTPHFENFLSELPYLSFPIDTNHFETLSSHINRAIIFV